jgi:ribose transport system permease protein
MTSNPDSQVTSAAEPEDGQTVSSRQVQWASGKISGTSSGSRAWLINFLEGYGLVGLLVIVIVVFGLDSATSSFLTQANLITVLGNQTVVATVALAALIPLSTGYVDLSSAAITGVSSCVLATSLTRFHQTFIVALILALVFGVLLGFINGILVAKFGLSAIIATLGVQIALGGLLLWYTDNQTIGAGMSMNLLSFGELNWLGIPRITWVFIPVMLASWYLLEQTPFGRYLQAISSNRRSARLVGINVQRSVVTCFAVSGGVAAIAGVLLTLRQGSADATTGPSYLFPALTGVFLGATVVRPGRPNVVGTMIGILFLAVTVDGLTLLGATSWAPDLSEGILLIAATGVSTIFARQRGGHGLF